MEEKRINKQLNIIDDENEESDELESEESNDSDYDWGEKGI